MSTKVPWNPDAPTPFDGQGWPEQLDARVVSGTRIHGYDAVRDLSRHYRFSDVVLLALTGELASDTVARAFEVALTCLAPSSVAEAPAHAGVLARVCEASASAVIATTAIGLAEQARFTVAAHGSWLASLDATSAPSPVAAADEVEPIREALAQIGVSFPTVDRASTAVEAILAIFHACGLVRPDQLESAWVMARLPVVVAEAFAAPSGRFKEYPLELPKFAYSEDQE